MTIQNRSRSRAVLLAALSLLALVVGLWSPAAGFAQAPPASTVNAQVLAINDFHGNLAPPASTINGVPAGGVEYLATHIRALEATNRRNTMVVAAGDLIGASPLVSALFHDEPSIQALSAIGLDASAVGNHEFDEGARELLRMQRGGCHPTDGCLDGDGFPGAAFSYLSANVVRDDTGQTLFRPYVLRNFDGVRVAFIGMTLEGTPTIVSPSGVAGLTFNDEADTVNALVPQLQASGVQAIVVLVHEGGLQTSGSGVNDCIGFSGAIVDIVNRLDPAVDAVISGHTHAAYNCVINDIPVTSASSLGRVVTDLDLVLDRATGDVTSVTANNVVVTRDVAPNPLMTSLLARYNAIAEPLANRVVGSITATISNVANAAGESALGDVIADSQLEATVPEGAQIAFMNPGGIRAPLDFGTDGVVTFGEIFTVQPFGNSLVTMNLTGTQIDTLLEQQFPGFMGQTVQRILQVSQSLTYTYSAGALAGEKIDPASIMLNGVALDPAGVYRVTVNSFLADGGDGFTLLRDGTDRVGGAVDLDALEAYFAAHSPVAPGPQNRITMS